MAAVIPKTLAAMAAGITTVTAGSKLLELTDTTPVPKFEGSFAGVSRWDQTEFVGRYRKMCAACNPGLILYSSESLFRGKARIDALQARVEAGDTDLGLSQEENLQLWKLKDP